MSQFDSFDQITSSREERALTIEVSGLRFPWLVDGKAIEAARDQGHQLGDALDELSVLDQALEESADMSDVANHYGDIYSAVAKLLWMGFVGFKTDLSLTDASGLVDASTISELPLEQMMDRIFPSADEQEEDGEEGN